MTEFHIFALFRTSIALGVHSLWAWWWAYLPDHAVHHATYIIFGTIAFSGTGRALSIMTLWAWWWANISDHATDVAHRLIVSFILAFYGTGLAFSIMTLWAAWSFSSLTWWSAWSTWSSGSWWTLFVKKSCSCLSGVSHHAVDHAW